MWREYCADKDAVCCKVGEEFCKGTCYGNCDGGRSRNSETCECEEVCREGWNRYASMYVTKTNQGGTSWSDAAVNLACSDVYDSYQTAPIYKCCKDGWTVKQISQETQTLNAYVPLYGDIACVIVTTTKNDCVFEEPNVICGEECCAKGCNEAGDACSDDKCPGFLKKKYSGSTSLATDELTYFTLNQSG